MKIPPLIISAFGLFLATPASAGSFANGVSLYSDRIRRGVSQTDGPGVAGEIKYNASSGWHAGLWVGTVGYDNVKGETFELLPFLSYDHRIGSFTAEVGALRHSYPGTDRRIDYDEIEFTLSHKIGRANVSAGAYYRLRNQSGGHSWYWFSDARVPLGKVEGAKVSLGTHAGIYRDPGEGGNDFDDESIGLFATHGRMILGVSVNNGNPSGRSTIPGARAAGTRLSVSFTRMFRRSF